MLASIMINFKVFFNDWQLKYVVQNEFVAFGVCSILYFSGLAFTIFQKIGCINYRGNKFEF